MYKKLRYGLIALLAFVGLTASAQVEFNFDADNSYQSFGLSGESHGADDKAGIAESHSGDISTKSASWTKDGFTVTVSTGVPGEDGKVATPNRIWNKSPKLRMYSGTLTVSGSGIKRIEFTGNDKFQLTPSTGTMKEKMVWEGNASEVVFTCAGNTQLSTLTINREENKPIIATIAEVLAAEDNKTVWYQLTGVITSIANTTYGNLTIKDETGSIYVYGVLPEKGSTDNNNFASLMDKEGIAVGKRLTIIGYRTSFKGDPQIGGAYFVSVENGIEPETYEVNVAQALDAASKLDEGETSFDNYQVTGYVVGTPNYYNGYEGSFTGTVDLYLADTKGGAPTLFIYHCLGPDNDKFTESNLNLFAEGDMVIFKGNLQNYVKDGTSTYELKNGWFVDICAPTSVSVDVPSSGLATFCSAYPIVIEDQNVYIVKEILKDDTGEDNKAKVEKIASGTVIAAGVGLIVEGEGTVTFAVSGDAGVVPEGNLLVGTLKPTPVDLFTIYALSEGAFCQCEGGTFPAGKAYLPVNYSSGAKIAIDFSGMTTSISEAKAQEKTNEIYTIGGVRVKNAQQKGIYIINGKKVVK